ncbi:collagen alpha-1(III) chain-like [Phyllostomus discolor]|uniref:Collagen alpha-1(III) chain-like n=1 Tax=Phyllostomus discolor TaxID=89673 RepID=A0A6J2MMC6_9CHIR|nr:collagen alpha-1(III) chain-like [Phyllostomus discolor]
MGEAARCARWAGSAHHLSPRRASVSEPPHGHGPAVSSEATQPDRNAADTPESAGSEHTSEPHPGTQEEYSPDGGGGGHVRPAKDWPPQAAPRSPPWLPGPVALSRANGPRDRDAPGRRSRHRPHRPAGRSGVSSLASAFCEDVDLSRRSSAFSSHGRSDQPRGGPAGLPTQPLAVGDVGDTGGVRPARGPQKDKQQLGVFSAHSLKKLDSKTMKAAAWQREWLCEALAQTCTTQTQIEREPGKSNNRPPAGPTSTKEGGSQRPSGRRCSWPLPEGRRRAVPRESFPPPEAGESRCVAVPRLFRSVAARDLLVLRGPESGHFLCGRSGVQRASSGGFRGARGSPHAEPSRGRPRGSDCSSGRLLRPSPDGRDLRGREPLPRPHRQAVPAASSPGKGTTQRPTQLVWATSRAPLNAPPPGGGREDRSDDDPPPPAEALGAVSSRRSNISEGRCGFTGVCGNSGRRGCYPPNRGGHLYAMRKPLSSSRLACVHSGTTHRRGHRSPGAAEPAAGPGCEGPADPASPIRSAGPASWVPGRRPANRGSGRPLACRALRKTRPHRAPEAEGERRGGPPSPIGAPPHGRDTASPCPPPSHELRLRCPFLRGGSAVRAPAPAGTPQEAALLCGGGDRKALWERDALQDAESTGTESQRSQDGPGGLLTLRPSAGSCVVGLLLPALSALGGGGGGQAPVRANCVQHCLPPPTPGPVSRQAEPPEPPRTRLGCSLTRVGFARAPHPGKTPIRGSEPAGICGDSDAPAPVHPQTPRDILPGKLKLDRPP